MRDPEFELALLSFPSERITTGHHCLVLIPQCTGYKLEKDLLFLSDR